MKRIYKVFFVLLPIVLVGIVVAGIFTFARADDSDIMPVSTVITSEYGGQVITGTADTGASTAALDYKGGSIFVEPNAEMYLEGGTISGHTNTYGGAIYVSSGALLQITGGIIENNSAAYGGAIYVESNAYLLIDGVTIRNNVADQGPAIYVEDGALLDITDSVIENNRVNYKLNVSTSKKPLGVRTNIDDIQLDTPTSLFTVDFGSYPKSFIYAEHAMSNGSYNGDVDYYPTKELGIELENTYANQPADVTYEVNSATWDGYRHTDGNIYVRGQQKFPSDRSSCSYQNNTIGAGGSGDAWFKVEPITWYILNYDEWANGEEDIKLLSEYAVNCLDYISNKTYNSNSDYRWQNNPFIRQWLNKQFYDSAFSEVEKVFVKQSNVYNNVPGDFDPYLNKVPNIGVDREDVATQDYVYLPSYAELNDDMFTNGRIDDYDDNLFTMPGRICIQSDFCLATGSPNNYRTINEEYVEACMYWTRSSPGNNALNSLVFVGQVGIFSQSSSDWLPGLICVRPMIQLTVPYEA